MKKTLLLALMAAFALPVSAQHLTAEVSGGLGLDIGSKYEAQLSLLYGFNIGNHFYLGAGTGFRFAEMLDGEWTIETTSSDVYQSEYNIPLFARARFTFGTSEAAPFVQIDGGWCFGVGGKLSNDGSVTMPKDYEHLGPKFDPRTKGFFYEPQVGYNFSPNIHASVGLMMQRYDEYHLVGTKELDAPGLNWEKQYLVNEMEMANFATAITLHLGFSF